MARKHFFQPAELMASDLEQATYFVHIDPHDGHSVLHMQLPPEPSFPRVPRWFSFSRSEQGLTWCKHQGVADMIECDDYRVAEISREEAGKIMAELRKALPDPS